MPVVINLDPGIYAGQWKEFLPGLDALIIPYTRRVVRKIMAAATIFDQSAGTGRVDPDLWDTHLYRSIVAGIRGPVAPDGSPVGFEPGVDNPAAPAIVDTICDQVEGFAPWALRCSQDAAAAISRQEETETKNSKRSPGGKRPAHRG